MSELLDILNENRQEVLQTYLKKLEQQVGPKLTQTEAGSGAAIFETFEAVCTDGNAEVANAWAGRLRDEAAATGITASDVLAALGCLERIVRFHIVKATSQKPDLLTALSQLSSALELLRRGYADAPLPVQEAAAYRPEDFVALAESMNVFICLTDLQGQPFYLNPWGRELLGLEDGSTELASSLYHYYSDSSWEELRDVGVPKVKESGQWEGQSQLRHTRTNEPIDMLTTMLLVRASPQAKASCLAVMHHNLGDNLQLQEALAESQARKHAILESALDPIITINDEGMITEFNKAAEQVFRVGREKVLGTLPSDVLFPPAESAGHQNRIDRYLDSGEGSLLGQRVEVEAVRANGETFPVEMAMTISHEQGLPVLTFFVRDISERKRAEKQQARYAAELKRSNRELEQFAYVASHDLQEPLRKIRTFSDRLEMKSADKLDDVGRECLERMQSAAARMQLLIEGLLTLSRVTTRGQSFEPVDLAQVTREVVSDLEVRIERVEGRVEVGRLPTIQADPLQMRQLLQNLIDNALKFHREEEPPVVRVHGRFVEGRKDRGAATEEKCRLVVEDNGVGFEEKYLDRVFGIFQRLHSRDVYEGTGIGLPICRRIVERHDGTITVRSKLGKGSTFEIILPAVHPKKE